MTTQYSARTPILNFDYITWNESVDTWDSITYTWDNAYTGTTERTTYNERTPV